MQLQSLIYSILKYFGVSWGIYPLLQLTESGVFFSLFCCTFSGCLTYTLSCAQSCHFRGLEGVVTKAKRKSNNNGKGTES